MGAVDTYPPANITSGPVTLGYGPITSGPTISTTETDLPGATATVFVAAGRRIKITGRMFIQSPSVANNEAVLWLSEDGVHKAHCVRRIINVNDAMDFHTEFVSSPAPGFHTYKLSGQITVGAGNFIVSTGSDRVGFIVVEDITGQSLPVLPQSVPVGLLGRAITSLTAATAYTTNTLVPGLSLNVTVPAGRILRVRAHVWITNSALTGVAPADLNMDGVKIGEGGVFATNTGHGHSLFADTIISPSAGAHTFEYRIRPDLIGSTITVYPTVAFESKGNWLTVEDITPTPAPASSAPSSTLGYAEKTSQQTGITTEVAVPELTATVTVPAGRRLRVSAFLHMTSSVADAPAQVRIKQDGTEIQFAQDQPSLAGGRFDLAPVAVLSPPAGTHTYTVTALRAGASNTVTVDAWTTDPCWLLVEDITGTSLAHSHDSAPSSTLAYAEATAATTIGAGPTDLPSLSVTVTVPAGRRIRINTDLPHYWYSDGTTTYAIQIYKNGVLWTTVGWTARVPVSESGSISGVAVDSPSAGTHTYKVVAVRSSGAGTLTVHGSSVSVQRLLVEDITGTGITGHTHTEFDIPTYYLQGSATPGSTGSGTFVNFPGVPTKTITKRRADTAINVAGHISCYKTTNTGYVDFALLLNGVDYWMTRFFFNNVGMHMDQGMFGGIGLGLPPGDYTIGLRWRVGSADANVDGNDFFHLTFREGMVV